MYNEHIKPAPFSFYNTHKKKLRVSKNKKKEDDGGTEEGRFIGYPSLLIQETPLYIQVECQYVLLLFLFNLK